MVDNELLITINADAKNATKAFDDVRAQTEELEDTLSNVAKISAVGFAVLTAEVGFALKAFEEADLASRKLNNALQVQGIYTTELAEKYKGYAEAVEDATGVDADNLVASQAVAQGYLGQMQITDRLTAATADLAESMGGDLDAAATALAKTIGTGTNAFKREGLQLDENATKAERYAAVLEFVEGRHKGAAAAANEGLGGLRGLATAFGNLQESIGAKFAPAASAAIEGLTDLFKWVNKSPEVTNFAVAMIAAGLAVTALGVAVPMAVTGLGIMRAAMTAAGIATTGTKLAVNALIGATGIGLLIVAITELALHWDSVGPRIKAVMRGLVEFATGAFGGLGKVLSGAFSLDLGMIKAGLAEVKEAFAQGAATATAELPKAVDESAKKQEEAMKRAAEKRAAAEAREQAQKLAMSKAEQGLTLLQLQGASQAQIDLKKAEIDAMKQLAATENQTQKDLLVERVEQIRAYEEEQKLADDERKLAYREEELAAREATDAEDFEYKTAQGEARRAQIEAQLLTEKETEQKIMLDKAAANVADRNKKLEDTKKYGVAYAAINQVLHSDELEGAKKASGEMVGMQQSKHQALKQIGKAAAVAQVIMKTAESAMNIYSGFSIIPFIGPALGVAGAAAAIAFGAEQIGNITAAQQGALVHGSGTGDKMPFMLEPGELVAPKKNFEEVVAGTQMIRQMESGETPGSGKVLIGFDGDEASRVLTARQVENRSLGISVDGDA